jgi:hypothetical protein
MRLGAAVGLVVALALGWVATSRMGHSTAPAAAAPIAPAGVGTRATLAPAARCDGMMGRSSEMRCSVDGIAVDYRLLTAASLSAVYVDAIGATTSRSGAGPPQCATGGADERSWARLWQPHRVAGRFACRREQGRAAMWWTIADRGLLAHAVAPDGDVASLYEWWLSHSER